MSGLVGRRWVSHYWYEPVMGVRTATSGMRGPTRTVVHWQVYTSAPYVSRAFGPQHMPRAR